MVGSWLSSVVLLVHRNLADRGLDANAIVRSAGIDPASLADPDARIPQANAAALWKAAVDAVEGDPCFGLDIALALHPTSLHAVGYAWMACSSLREAGQRLGRYFRVINSVDRLDVRHEGELTWLVFCVNGPYTFPRAYDARVAVIVKMCRGLLGDVFAPTRVRQMHARPPERCAARMVEFYGVEPEWNAAECAIAVPTESLDKPLSAGNGALALASEQIAADYLARHMRDDVVTRVRRCMIELLPSGDVSRQAVARKLAMGERTMQRRLTEAGTSYAELLEALRRELAVDYLRTRRNTVHEVAYLLGFAEIASFTRAFRRWTGVPPSIWRERGFAS